VKSADISWLVTEERRSTDFGGVALSELSNHSRFSLLQSRHSRGGGNPDSKALDSRLRGNDGTIAALDAESAEVLQTIRGL
jgi:hypothetical protein